MKTLEQILGLGSYDGGKMLMILQWPIEYWINKSSELVHTKCNSRNMKVAYGPLALKSYSSDLQNDIMKWHATEFPAVCFISLRSLSQTLPNHAQNWTHTEDHARTGCSPWVDGTSVLAFWVTWDVSVCSCVCSWYQENVNTSDSTCRLLQNNAVKLMKLTLTQEGSGWLWNKDSSSHPTMQATHGSQSKNFVAQTNNSKKAFY